MHQRLIVLIIASCVALVLAGTRVPENKPQNAQRETDWKVSDGVLNAWHREKVFENANSRVDVTALLNKNLLNKQDPTKIGGQVDYKSLNSNSGASIKALNAGRFGTKVGVEGLYNLYKDRNSAVDVGVGYEQRFGGMFGKGEPNVNAFIRAGF